MYVYTYVCMCVWTLVNTRGVYALPKKIANWLNFVNLIKMDKSIWALVEGERLEVLYLFIESWYINW